MGTETQSNRKSVEGNAASITEGFCTVSAVTSKVGTTIGDRQYGHSRGAILVMGAMGTAHNYDQLATALAGNFTGYAPDRRGRGMSPRKYSPDHSIERESVAVRISAERGKCRLYKSADCR
jgi:hypothetical protein